MFGIADVEYCSYLAIACSNLIYNPPCYRGWGPLDPCDCNNEIPGLRLTVIDHLKNKMRVGIRHSVALLLLPGGRHTQSRTHRRQGWDILNPKFFWQRKIARDYRFLLL